MKQPDLDADIAALLEAAATAHSVYEAESLGGSDDQWPAWYAAYLLEQGLRDRLPRTVSGDPNTLANRLMELDVEFQRADPSGDWCRFYAKRLVTSERDAPAEGRN
jgi:hypothetical protein